MRSRNSLQWLALMSPSTSFAASLSRRVVPQQADHDICAVISGRIAIAADTLYFTGGKYTFKGGDTESTEPYLYSIRLNNSFPVDGPLVSNSYDQSDSPAQWGSEGAFFQDANETMLYSYGGYSNDKQQPPTNTLNTYNITSSEWSNTTVSGGDFNFYVREATSRAISTGSSSALGFVSGGWNDVPGMIRFDASDPANPQWRNETDNKTPLTLEGRMEYIRLGPKGSLINFGGYNKDYINPNYTGWSYDRRPMSQINVYDISSSIWYNVTASGDIPTDRSAFCTAVSSAPDDSSFQITLYAGWDLFGGHSFADTYVLSIPSFQWINVTDPSNLDAHLSTSGRSGRDHHQCASYKDRQMLLLGGILLIDEKKANIATCNQKYPAVRALDLSTFKWSSTWNGKPDPYFVPDAVTRIIGGTGRGGATLKQPAGGFNDSALNSVFAQVAARYTPGPASGPSSNPGNSSPNPPPPAKSNTGAIAGGVVGGIAFLAIIVAAIVFVLMRRRKRRTNDAAAAAAALRAAPPYTDALPRDGKPLEMMGDERQRTRGGYFKEPVGGGLGVGARGYEPVRATPEMDAGWRGSELGGNTEGGGDRRRAVGELPG